MGKDNIRSARGTYRPQGSGTVRRTRNRKWIAITPSHGGKGAIQLPGTFDFRHHAEAALLAWLTVHAPEVLPRLREGRYR